VLIHLDTDIGGDVDDLCALAMLLGWPGVEIAGITTSVEEDGRRAGYVRRALELAGRQDVPVAAGIDVASDRFRYRPAYPREERYWGSPIERAPGDPEQALALLRASIGADAVVIAIGPLTNLAELEARQPGSLAGARLVVMGGRVHAPRAGFPDWGVADDYNLQLDVAAAATVLNSGHPLVVPLSMTAETSLRRAYLPALRAAGPLAALVARQAEAQGEAERNEERFGRRYAGLPDDTLAFLHDPLACAIALGWRDGVRVETVTLTWRLGDGLLHLAVEGGGRPTDLVVAIDGPTFGEAWLGAVGRIAAGDG
jgi:inosine-uridine nucleoside N-ribohydrolase